MTDALDTPAAVPDAYFNVCSEIRRIMQTYREQEERGSIDTPGGLEHMGDVWRQLDAWDRELASVPAPPAPAEAMPGDGLARTELASLGDPTAHHAARERVETGAQVVTDEIVERALKGMAAFQGINYRIQPAWMRAALEAVWPTRPSAEPAPAPADLSHRVTIPYTNWRGEHGFREIVPIRLFWGSNEWHPEPQCLIEAWDIAKSEIRTFALAGIGAAPAPPAGDADQPRATVAMRQLEECLPRLEAPIRRGGTNSEDSYEVYDEFHLYLASAIRALIQPRARGEQDGGER